MSYSALVDYVRISPNSTNPRNKKVNAIVIHHAGGNITVENLGAWFDNPAQEAASNYGVGTDGRIGCYVHEENRAWTSGNRAIDNRAITIEVANCSGNPDWRVSDQALEATIALCVDICRRYGFKLTYTGDKSGSLHMHKWYQSTDCPGPYLGGKFPYIAEEVNRRLSGEPEKPVTPEKSEGGYVLNLRTLRNGCSGEDVRALQILIHGRGYNCGVADGIFGAKTEAAVRKYQDVKKLGTDGIVGPATMGSLMGA